MQYTQSQQLSEDLDHLDVNTISVELKGLHFCAQFHRSEAIRGIELLKHVCCSTNLVEKGHAAGSFVKKYHARMHEEQLRARAFVNECRVLCRESKPDQARRQLEATLQQRMTQFWQAACRLRSQHLLPEAGRSHADRRSR